MVDSSAQSKIKVETKSEKVKIDEPKKDVSGAPAKKVNVAIPKKDEEDEDSDDDDDDDDDDESDDKDKSGSEMDADSDEDGSDEDEKTPVKKVTLLCGRPEQEETKCVYNKTPVPAAKKAKNVTPAKSGGKKISHAPTPHPVKKGGNPNSAEKF
ncbi:histone deacetylase HDT1-like [Arachis stenosperma]|uniref:histone deacetylase HDT1-like n=1 Tax=Arachis stenosperma TaxID=217475 RepID=UPI0025AB6B93|nr:histone deacetylase HDT1-like [Arachis stenosperma]